MSEVELAQQKAFLEALQGVGISGLLSLFLYAMWNEVRRLMSYLIEQNKLLIERRLREDEQK